LADIGGAGIDRHGKALPDSTLQLCAASDAILFGSVGGPKWEKLPPKEQPERAALLPLRKYFTLFANIRPGLLYRELTDASPLKTERIPNGIDIVCIRELTGGLYFGKPKETTTLPDGDVQAVDTMVYRKSEIERITATAIATARSRKNKLCSVDKANVLETSVLWRKTVTEYVAKHAPEIQLTHMYVDNAAMQLILRPSQFDVLLTSNMFGDILSDAAAALVGSIGLVPSASFGSSAPLFEPIHGSAPSLAGTDTANPIGSILSVTMMLRDAFGLSLEADWIEQSLVRVLSGGYRTPDITEPGARAVGGSVFAEILREEMQRTLEHAERYGWGV
jgi:3-isopropylmalate dehydrogenase